MSTRAEHLKAYLPGVYRQLTEARDSNGWPIIGENVTTRFEQGRAVVTWYRDGRHRIAHVSLRPPRSGREETLRNNREAELFWFGRYGAVHPRG